MRKSTKQFDRISFNSEECRQLTTNLYGELTPIEYLDDGSVPEGRFKRVRERMRAERRRERDGTPDRDIGFPELEQNWHLLTDKQAAALFLYLKWRPNGQVCKGGNGWPAHFTYCETTPDYGSVTGFVSSDGKPPGQQAVKDAAVEGYVKLLWVYLKGRGEPRLSKKQVREAVKKAWGDDRKSVPHRNAVVTAAVAA